MKNYLAIPSILIASLAAWFRPEPPQISGDIREALSHISMVDFQIDDNGHTVRTLRITGVNVQIVNGMEQTNMHNGAGNLIVGYSEPGFYTDRGGSHNLVVGTANQWTNYATGGIVAGCSNTINNMECSILGGEGNEANGPLSAILGGTANMTFNGSHAGTIGGGSMRYAYQMDDFAAGSLYEDN